MSGCIGGWQGLGTWGQKWYRAHQGELVVPRGCRGCFGVSGRHQGVSGVYCRASRDSRYSGARERYRGIRGIGVLLGV